jgi:hypothetical protein
LGIVVVIVVFSFCVGCSLCVYFVYCVSFDRYVILYDVCYSCMMCVICELCLIVVPLPPGENPFAIKYKYIYTCRQYFLINIKIKFKIAVVKSCCVD